MHRSREGTGGLDPPEKSCHHQPASKTPLKWHFTCGLIVTRLEYWYRPPLPTLKYKTKAKNKIFGPFLTKLSGSAPDIGCSVQKIYIAILKFITYTSFIEFSVITTISEDPNQTILITASFFFGPFWWLILGHVPNGKQDVFFQF